MSRDPGLYLDTLALGATRILEATRGLDLQGFSEDWILRDAVIRNLEVIGEAARRLPAHLRRKYPDIPWQQLARLREVLVHAYFQIDDSILWSLVQDHLSDLKQAAEELREGALP